MRLLWIVKAGDRYLSDEMEGLYGCFEFRARQRQAIRYRTKRVALGVCAALRERGTEARPVRLRRRGR
jgi:hypothetical protein